MNTENLNYDLELRTALEEELLNKWEVILNRKKNKRESWGKLVKWLIEHEGIDARLTDKRLMSFCRRHARNGLEIDAWAGKKWKKKVKDSQPGKLNLGGNSSGLIAKVKSQIVSQVVPFEEPDLAKELGITIGDLNPPKVAPSESKEAELRDIGTESNVSPIIATNIPGVPKFGRRMTPELAKEIRDRALVEEETERLKKIQSDKDWDLQGSSGEGMFTQEEIDRRNAWKKKQEALGKPVEG